MIEKTECYGIICMKDSDLKFTYSEEMYNSLISEPKYIQMVETAIELNSRDFRPCLANEVKLFIKIAKENNISHSERMRVAMKIWGLSCL